MQERLVRWRVGRHTSSRTARPKSLRRREFPLASYCYRKSNPLSVARRCARCRSARWRRGRIFRGAQIAADLILCHVEYDDLVRRARTVNVELNRLSSRFVLFLDRLVVSEDGHRVFAMLGVNLAKRNLNRANALHFAGF